MSPNIRRSRRAAGARARISLRTYPAHLPAGSIAVKAAWRLLTSADTPATRARYYVVENAELVDIAKTLAAGRTVCSKSDVALVGLHIVIKTKYRPQGLWSTFEHVDNVPPAGEGQAREPDAKDAGAPYSFFDPSRPELGLWPTFGSPATLPVSRQNPPKIDPEPMQVVRRHPIHPSTMALNRAYWALPGIKGTVWEYYMLVASQWPTVTHPADPQNDGSYFPGLTLPPDAARENYQSSDADGAPKENLVNTTIETYLQDPPSSCMSCHQAVSNALGRDFVGILASFRSSRRAVRDELRVEDDIFAAVERKVDRVAGFEVTAHFGRADAEHHLHRGHAAHDVVMRERQPAGFGLDRLDEAPRP